MIKLGLIGWPVSHSFSPAIHNAALNALNIAGEYSLFPVDPQFPLQMSEVVERLRKNELTGLNVTIPHKKSIYSLLDDLTPSARAIGAVNTIYLENGRVIGHNTDAPGFKSDLLKKADIKMSTPGNAIMLGAGGSARAVLYVLFEMKWKVTLAVRNPDKAREMVLSFGEYIDENKVEIIKLEPKFLEAHLNDTNLLINTTPVGMTTMQEHSPWRSSLPLPKGAFVYDLIYTPSITSLLKSAQEQGLRATNGLGMLVEQAALAFEIWTGHQAPREVMLAAVQKFIK